MTEQRSFINRNRKAIFGFAALLIYAFHGWKAIFSDIPGLYEIENFFRRYGDVGVDIFLFLSGMGLVHSWKNSSSYREFILRRLKRILVPSIVAAFLFLIAHWHEPAHAIKAVTGYYFLTGQLNTFLWFGYAIMLLYLCFPFYYRGFEKSRSKVLFTFTAVVLWLLFIYLLNGHVNDWSYIFLNRVPIFLIGICANHLSQQYHSVKALPLYVASLAMLAVGYFLSFQIKEGGLSLWLPHSYALFPYMMMAISLVLLLSRLFLLLPHRILDFYGLFTFEFYCVQERIIQLCKNAFTMLPVFADNVIVLLIATGCAYLLYLLNQQIWKRKKK